MYKFSYQNKLFDLYIFKLWNDVTEEDTKQYNKDILKLAELKTELFIVYDISEVTNWFPINNFITHCKKLFSSTKLIKDYLKGCSIIVGSNYINSFRFVFKIVCIVDLCDYYITDKPDDAFVHLNNHSTKLHINSN